jgi:DNA-binding NtrC family response regulator
MLSGETAGELEIEIALSAPETVESGGRGRTSSASGGTLYIDEIGAIPAAAQDRLAAFFEMRDRHAAPGERSQRNDICVIAAASYPLIDLVSAGRFREDLFYRLSVTPIWLPPLRERRAEIPHLARRILARLGADEVRSGIFGISTAATDLLSTYDWPGNFRELENAIFRAMLLCEGSELSPLDFPQLVTPSGNGLLPDGSSCPTASARIRPAHPEQLASEKPLALGSRADTRIAARYGIAKLLDDRGEMRPIGMLEEEVIRFAIDHYRGQMSEVARRLGIGRSTLYRKVRDYGIAPAEAALP